MTTAAPVAYRWTRADGKVFVIDPREVEVIHGMAQSPPREAEVCFNCAREHVLNCEEQDRIPSSDPWCRREDCQYRNWRSGSMPTHRRGAGCPGEGVCTYTTSTADYCHTHDAYLANADGRCEKATGAES